MDSEAPLPATKAAGAWQPVTFGGAAALATAGWGRLFLVGLIVAGVMALAATRTLYATWVPAIEAAIKALPVRCQIRDGRLSWPGTIPVRLADNAFLSIAVTQEGFTGAAVSDVAIEFAPNGLVASSILGSLFVPYPRGLSISIDRTDLTARWLAWRPHVAVGTFLLVLGAVWLTWLAVGFACAPFLRLYVAMLSRCARLSECVRLGISACMPGELLMASGVALYGMRRISFAELMAIGALHVLVVAVYVLLVPLWVPARAEKQAGGTNLLPKRSEANPFAGPPNRNNEE